MNDAITLRKIAEMVGCSDSTVSRVLNGKARQYRISAETEQQILKLAKELNFVPNPLAASLRTHRTLTIGLVIPDVSNPFFAGIVPVIQGQCRKAGYSVLLANTEEKTRVEVDSVAMLHKRQIDGLIIAPVGERFDHLLELREKGLPIVLIDRYAPDLPFPYVTSDNFRGAYDAVTYLIECGHVHIACLQGVPYTSPNQERVAGYRQALEDAGIPFNEDWVAGDSFIEENGYYETRILMKDVPRPTALLALSNLIALGAMRAVHEEHLRIPADVSLIAFDDQPFFQFFQPPLTAIAQPYQEMGQKAIEYLLRELKDSHEPHKLALKLPVKLIRRGSVKML
ncbi:MAG: LacI family transcriptional regulator [candidate division KSB1 bacterium]|nr:LacI family transcriptional regulator [candidate division KSB1 bacterium]